LKAGDLRLRLIQHAEDPSALTRALSAATQRAESEFERRVIRRLHEKGYRTHSQWPVGAYRIDIVVVGTDGQKVAVECDGDRYHPSDNLRADMDRQMILERLGWRFVRIRGSRFFRDPDGTMTKVYDDLDQLGIEPIGPEPSPPGGPVDGTELRQRIIRRAEELHRDWREADQAACRSATPARPRRVQRPALSTP
jgi:very-short-patch-repair endonuclease